MSSDFVWALAGGVLIGLSAAFLLLANGRVAGISGIFAGVLVPHRGEFTWRLAFVLGLLLTGSLVLVIPERFDTSGMPSLSRVIVAGLLVGFGTRLGHGCTSGHGICGLGRGSKRSIVATITFMISAAVTVFVTRHI